MLFIEFNSILQHKFFIFITLYHRWFFAYNSMSLCVFFSLHNQDSKTSCEIESVSLASVEESNYFFDGDKLCKELGFPPRYVSIEIRFKLKKCASCPKPLRKVNNAVSLSLRRLFFLLLSTYNITNSYPGTVRSIRTDYPDEIHPR